MLVSTLFTLTPLIWAANALPIAKRDTSTLSTRSPGSNWVKLGCYTDTVAPRSLTGPQIVSDVEMTNAYCQQLCESRGFTIAGTEQGKECYCDNTIDSSLLADPDTCDMNCTGDSEVCGGDALLTVWQDQGTPTPDEETIGDWTGQGCYVDPVNARVLTPMPDALAPMTVKHCVDACAAAGFTVAGVEHASECYCGNTLPPVSTADGCVMQCAGDSAHMCGGPDRLNVYQKTVTTVDPLVDTPVDPPVCTPSVGTPVNVSVQQSCTPHPSKTNVIRINDACGSPLGFLASSFDTSQVFSPDPEITRALTFEIQGFSESCAPFSLHQLNAPADQEHTYLGAYLRNAEMQFLDNVGQTSTGSAQSAIWKLNPTTPRLSSIWVQDDGNAAPTIQVLSESGTNFRNVFKVNKGETQVHFSLEPRAN